MNCGTSISGGSYSSGCDGVVGVVVGSPSDEPGGIQLRKIIVEAEIIDTINTTAMIVFFEPYATNSFDKRTTPFDQAYEPSNILYCKFSI
jgi:hypothetical protein